MEKRTALMLGALCLSFSLLGQSTLKFLNSNPSVGNFVNIWVVNYESSSTTGSNVQLELELRKDGQIVYRATTNPVMIVDGMQVVSIKRVGLASEVFRDAVLGTYVQTSRALPGGTYTACVSEVASGQNASRACIEFSVSHRNQLRLLHIPNKKSISIDEQPIFSWMFLSSSIRSSDVTYSFTLCEILEGQSEQDAILRNVPILHQKGIAMSSLRYPIEAQKLEPNKKYAWFVEASFGDVIASISEVWMFFVNTDSKDVQLMVPPPYLNLNAYREGEHLNISGVLFNLRLDHSSNRSQLLRFEIVDEQGKVLKSAFEPIETVYGVNYISLDLSEVKKLKNNKSYVLVVGKGEDEITKVNFTYLKN